MPGGKVGGIGDVVRDLPLALARGGRQCTVLTPGYGVFGRLAGAKKIGRVRTDFGGASEVLDLYRLPGNVDSVEYLALEHPLFAACGAGRIYCSDPKDRPFATDATRFALFSAAAAAYVTGLGNKPSVVHLNDWHTAFYLLLRAFDPAQKALLPIRTVYTIHNLALQGIRPLADDPSSLETWFPKLEYRLSAVVDPRYKDCMNAMAIGIRLADAVNTVSPTYLAEITTPGHDHSEGLANELALPAREHRLFGILNGCDYPERKTRKPSFKTLLQLATRSVRNWMGNTRSLPTALYLAERKLAALPARRPAMIVTSIGRLTPQKARLFLEPLPARNSGEQSVRDATGVTHEDTPLERILSEAGSDVCIIILGSGDPEIEVAISRISVTHANLIFLNGFDEQLADALYAIGDLFLMPSTFEPCGISQMLAMRAGQPCVVNDVGGLHDTVNDNVNGFVFSGDTIEQQAEAFVARIHEAITLKRNDPDGYKAMRQQAASARFSWDAAAREYDEKLYREQQIG